MEKVRINISYISASSSSTSLIRMSKGKAFYLFYGALFALLILIEFTSADCMDIDRNIFRRKRDRDVNDEFEDNKENVGPRLPNQLKKRRTIQDGKQFEEVQTSATRPKIVIRRKGVMSESNLSEINVRTATDGQVIRSPKQAEIFKTAVEDRSKGISETFILTGQSCANGLGNLYKK